MRDQLETRARPRSRAPEIIVKPTPFERALSWVSPRLARNRAAARFQYDVMTRGLSAVLRSYEGASVGRRTGGWTVVDQSANSAILQALSRLRARSRDLARNNAYAAKAVREIDLNTIGAGILPRFSSAKKNERAVEQAKALWQRWAETKDCDAEGLHDFYGLQGKAARTFAEAGEVLVRKVYRKMDGERLPLQLLVLEPDFLDASKDGILQDGNQLVQGIEFDRLGRRLAYWLHQTHPGDRWAYRRGDSVRVPASEIMHVFEQERPGQARGVPRAASVILRLRNFDEYEDAQLQKQIIAACFAGYMQDASGASSAPATPSSKTAAGSRIEALESGTMEELPPGKTVTFSDPPTVDGYADFASEVLHAVAAGYGVPYEVLTGNYARFNFSSGRMSWLSFSRQIDVWRWRMIIPMLCQPVAEAFLQTAQDAGLLRDQVDVAWRPPRREMITPKEEIPAIRGAVRSGLMSLPQAIMEVSGENPEDVLAEIAKSNAELDRLGIVLDSDPRKISLSGAEQPSVSVELQK